MRLMAWGLALERKRLISWVRLDAPGERPAPLLGGAGLSLAARASQGAAASARGARAQAGEAAAAARRGAPEADGGARAALHCRLFALLLRYKAITGAGFQAALPPAAFDVLHAQCAATRAPC
jgi:hypothetical protein